ncbi:EamA family transporter RarD [Anaerobacillus sp. MEB173]|uniref:EamA family transporter RarD n=1 Tax=Anaerobacillus sp. MEB173 TaxID=3383345 RepID=UPI003F93E0C4
MNLDTNEQKNGIISALSAYILWGVLPLYWKLMESIPPGEVLAHRIIWSLGLLAIILFSTRKLSSFYQEFHRLLVQPKSLMILLLTSIVISINWFIYIWAVNNDHIIETSLGYYINPLVNVLLGILFLKEKLSFWQMVSVFLAFIGVLILTVQFGSIPWPSLILAITFGIYGLLKKVTNLGSISGLTAETLLIMPIAAIYITYIQLNGHSSFGFESISASVLLIGGGVATAIPLLLFATGAKKIPLWMIGFLQYIAPTITLFIGVFLYHEPFTKVHLITFMFIWSALIIFTLSKTKFMVGLEPKFLHKNKSFGS